MAEQPRYLARDLLCAGEVFGVAPASAAGHGAGLCGCLRGCLAEGGEGELGWNLGPSDGWSGWMDGLGFGVVEMGAVCLHKVFDVFPVAGVWDSGVEDSFFLLDA